jgi:hypothetical protein
MSSLSIKHQAVLGLTAIAIAAMPATALAWHPKGTIKKEVMNVTQGIAYSDANTSATAVAAKPGDTLKYRVTVTDTAAPAANEWNDLYYVVMTDKFPAGITASADAHETLGHILPGKSVTREYDVKVAANASGLVKNTACFTGNSKVNDNAQSGCDDAYVNVIKPAPTPSATPSPTKTPATPSPTASPVVLGSGDAQPTVLPQTGTEAALGGLTGLSAIAYATTAYFRSRRSLTDALKSQR